MKNVKKLALVSLMSIGLSGCIGFRADEHQYKTLGEIGPRRHEYSIQKVTLVKPVVTRRHDVVRIELVAEGEFNRHDFQKYKVDDLGVQIMYFGVTPGILNHEWRDEEITEGEKVGMAAAAQISFFILPTLYSLVVEPFNDYHHRTGFEALGLLGFAKRYIDVGGQSDVEKELGVYNVSTMKLRGCRLSINGKVFDPVDGCVELHGINAGTILCIKVLSKPMSRSDSLDALDGIVGLELKAVCK